MCRRRGGGRGEGRTRTKEAHIFSERTRISPHGVSYVLTIGTGSDSQNPTWVANIQNGCMKRSAKGTLFMRVFSATSNPDLDLLNAPVFHN